MDPVANLAKQRELIARINELADSPGASMFETDREQVEDLANAAIELADLAGALDEWRRNGGFDPYEAQARQSWSA